MKKRVDWILKDNSYVSVVRKDIVSDFIEGKEIIVYENDAQNRIDLVKKIYERKTDEYTMTIDFKKEICSFIFSSLDRCSFDIKASLQETKTKIVLKYIIDEEEKEIDVSWKE